MKPATTVELPETSPDPILEKIAEAIRPVGEQIDGSQEHSLVVLGTKLLNSETSGTGVETYTQITGYYGVIAEGLYAELSDQISKGNAAFFGLIRQVIHDLEEDFDIEPGDVLEDHDKSSLH
jgi:hypothetical protein